MRQVFSRSFAISLVWPLLSIGTGCALVGCGTGDALGGMGDGSVGGDNDGSVNGDGPQGSKGDGGGGGGDGGGGGGNDGGGGGISDGGNGGDPANFVSGTRLRAKRIQLGGGVTRFAGWYDSQLQTDCAYELAEDGKYHCLPSSSYSGATYFADANCTQQLVSSSCGVPGLSLLFVIPDNFCTGQPFAYRAYQRTKVHVGAVYFGSGGSCQMLNNPMLTTWEATPVAPAQFVGAALTSVAAGAALTVTHLDGDDGSHQRVWQYGGPITDTARAAACKVFIGANYSLDDSYCLPAATPALGIPSIFSDAACTLPLYDGPARCGADAFAILDEKASGACHSTVRHLQPAYVPQNDYRAGGGQCRIEGSAPNFTYQPIGNAVLAAEVPTLKLSAPAGTAPEAFNLLSPTGELLVEAAVLGNPATHADCTPYFVGNNGDERCLPSDIAYATGAAFLDAACSEEAVLQSGCGTPTVAMRYVVDCVTRVNQIVKLGAASQPAAYYQKTVQGACVKVTNAGSTLFPVGAVVDPATFPAITYKVD